MGLGEAALSRLGCFRAGWGGGDWVWGWVGWVAATGDGCLPCLARNLKSPPAQKSNRAYGSPIIRI